MSSRIEIQTHGFHSAALLSQCLGLGPILKLLLFNKKGGGWLKYKYLVKKKEEKKKEVEKRHECLMQQKKKIPALLNVAVMSAWVIGSGSGYWQRKLDLAQG